MKKLAFLVNSVIKKHGAVISEIEDVFAGVADIRIFNSAYPGHIEVLAAEAIQEGYNYIITVGGDGTINETVNGIFSCFKTGKGNSPADYDWDAASRIRFGLLPRGSGNDFARYFGIGGSTLELKNKIIDEKIMHVDVGHTNCTGKDGRPRERFFMNITDVGMGGATVKHMADHRVSWLSSDLNYMKAIFSAFMTHKRTRVRWTSEDDSWEGKVMSIVVANGKFFGSGLGVAPDAKIDDGLFELVVLADITMWDYIKNIGRIKSTKRIEHPEVTYNRVKKVTLEPIDGQPLPIDMDGDFGGFCPMTLECIPGALGFLT